MKSCLFLFNSISPFSRKKVYGGESFSKQLSMVTAARVFYCRDCGTPMQEAVGLQKLSFETSNGHPLENRVRLLCCPKKRWFHRRKHATRLVSFDYVMEYIQG